MGVGEWFSEFCGNLQVKDGGTISDRYKAITRPLNTDFWDTTSDTAHSLYVGSYGRNTAIEGFSDLDMIMQLPYATYTQYNDYVGNGQSALLQAVKKSIEKTYSTTNIRADGQVIQVPFTDGITFEGRAGLHQQGRQLYVSQCERRRQLENDEPHSPNATALRGGRPGRAVSSEWLRGPATRLS